MQVLNDLVGYENRKIYQDSKYFSFSLDSIMLANFVNIRMKDKNILDLGTGNGVIPLVLSLRTKSNIIGVELQKELAKLAIKSVKYNNLEKQIQIVNINMKDYVSEKNLNTFDVITCNPPYFKVENETIISLSKEKAIARHELEITLSDIFYISKKLLKDHGRFALVHRTDRLYEILNLFKENNIEPKRLQFVYDRPNQKSNLVMIEGIKNGHSTIEVEKPIILYNEDGTETSEYKSLLQEVS